MGKELVRGRTDIAEVVPITTFYPPGWVGKSLNKTPKYNMTNRVCVVIFWCGVSFIMLPCEYIVYSSPAFSEHWWGKELECNVVGSLTGQWKAWSWVAFYIYNQLS